MALTRLNYAPGQYETCTNETLTPASPVLNTWYHFEIGNWKHLLADIVLKQGGSAIPTTAYQLAIDTKYTEREAGGSGKTIYAKWRIVDGDYDGITTAVSGSNFGTYIDNEKLDDRIGTLESFASTLDAGDVPYDNSSSGLTAVTVQAAIDEIATVKTIIATGSVSGSLQNIDISVPYSDTIDVIVSCATAGGNNYVLSFYATTEDPIMLELYKYITNSGNLRVIINWTNISTALGVPASTYKVVVRYTP